MAAMFLRLFLLALLCGATLAAGAEGSLPALQAPAAADWEALLCAALVALYVARRRSQWHGD
jgi:hypothetical protein